MSDSFRPDGFDDPPQSEPSTLITAAGPALGAAEGPTESAPHSAMNDATDGPSSRAPDHGAPSDHTLAKKPRPKLTLRIPDDEVARPLRPAPSAAQPPPSNERAVTAAPITAQRIINLRVDTPTKEVAVPTGGGEHAPAFESGVSTLSPTPGIPPRPLSIVPPPSDEDTSPRGQSVAPPAPVDEDSWTPFQPTVADQDPSDMSIDIAVEVGGGDAGDSLARTELGGAKALGGSLDGYPDSFAPEEARRDLAPVAPGRPPEPAVPAPDDPAAFSSHDTDAESSRVPTPPPPRTYARASDSFPDMVFDDDGFPSSPPLALTDARVTQAESLLDERVTSPRLPILPDDAEQVAPLLAHNPLPNVSLPPPRARSVATLDVDEISVETDLPAASEPSEASEISPEDVVSVEAVGGTPRAAAPSVPPPPMRPRAVSSPSFLTSVSAPPPPPTAPKLSRPSGSMMSTATIKTSVPPEHGAVASKPRPMVIVPGASPLAPPPMSDATSVTRKRARPWWEELFNDDFVRTMAKISDAQIASEVDFIEESLGLDKGAMVLDLACGTGRHAVELTRRGYQVVGFDLSLSMLAKAADEAQERDQKLNFVQGDMREMTFDGTFDGIYSWSTSFGFFEEEKNATVVANVRRALKPGGQVLLDVVNRDFVAHESPSLVWFEGDGCVCMDDMSIDWITSRMKVKRTMMMDDGRSREIEYSIRIYSLHELGKLLHDNGFRVVQVSGRIATPGVFFGADSPRTLILAEKK